MAEHRASCQCGQLRVTAVADPDFVIACNCDACKKRSGSPYGAGGYSLKKLVQIDGRHKSWTRGTDSGNTLTNHFCPECGTNVFWTLDLRPDYMGVALGTFDTPIPTPWRVVWTTEQLDWVQFPGEWEHYEKGSPPPR